jgi:hypothetical protein
LVLANASPFPQFTVSIQLKLALRTEVINRLILAKQLLISADAACSVPNDQWAFTRGLILLHDAAESALGAVADHLHAIKDPRKDVFLLGYCDLIEKADPQNVAGKTLRHVPYQQQLRVLNTLRNNAKHSGILPDQKSNAHFPSTISALVIEICQSYLGLALDEIRLTSLIRDDTIRGYLEEAETHFSAKDYENALISLSYAMFYVVDSEAVHWSIFDRLVPALRESEPPKYAYPDFYDVRHSVRLIERGVDLHLHRHFHLLTPLVGRETESGSPVYKWEKHYGHPGNWTHANVSFCLGFCIDAALKFQREDAHDYSIVPYSAVYDDVIEPAKDQAIIWNISSDTSDYFPRAEPYVRKPLIVLAVGETLVGEANDEEKKPHEWRVLFRASLEGKPETTHFGYVAKEEVKITRRKKGL